jgi:hypothetical protein
MEARANDPAFRCGPGEPPVVYTDRPGIADFHTEHSCTGMHGGKIGDSLFFLKRRRFAGVHAWLRNPPYCATMKEARPVDGDRT